MLRTVQAGSKGQSPNSHLDVVTPNAMPFPHHVVSRFWVLSEVFGLGSGAGSFTCSVNDLHPRCPPHWAAHSLLPHLRALHLPLPHLARPEDGPGDSPDSLLSPGGRSELGRNPSWYQADIFVVSKHSDEIERESERTTPPPRASSVDTTNDTGSSS